MGATIPLHLYHTPSLPPPPGSSHLFACWKGKGKEERGREGGRKEEKEGREGRKEGRGGRKEGKKQKGKKGMRENREEEKRRDGTKGKKRIRKEGTGMKEDF